ncbi:MAG: radical SAM family heme chaperone HemW [Bacteroidia bacterium]|nr:radical SAM family heme chaperone HemW [Bacteroidia bacterium]MDW8134579.1 radical SAM family heme chaperone HemW [Bacteroidia bacterium]
MTPFWSPLPPETSLGLYIHVPFCRRACHYCDFYFTPRASLMEAYVEALQREIALYRPLLDSVCIGTVFIGGGTPSWLPESLWEKVWNTLYSLPTFQPEEITLEANPEDITSERIECWKSWGINRVSVGVQSLSSSVLQTLGRWHIPERAKKAVEVIVKQGIPSWSVDLIFGVPGQSLKEWEEDLNYFVSLRTPHLSLYGLTIEPRTVLFKKLHKKRIAPVEDEEYREMYLLAHQILSAAGYNWYEISNWALSGYECKHNWRYWLRKPYLGLGPSAHSFVPEKRWWNKKPIQLYMEALDKGEWPYEKVESLTRKDKLIETWITQFRTRVGISLSKLEVEKQEVITHLTKWEMQKWLRREDDTLVLTPEGALMMDYMVECVLRYLPD